MNPAIHAHPTLKLGRPGGVSTRDHVRLAEIANISQLQAAPLVAVADAGAPDLIGGYGNDHLGDCTCATAAGVLVSDAAARGVAIDFADAEVEAMYRSSGWDGTPATDNGWTIADAASYMQHTGLRDTSGTLHRYGPVAQIDYTNWDEVMLALLMFGSLHVGIDLCTAWQATASDPNVPWDAVPDSQGGEPGSWGGHSLTLVRGHGGGAYLRTWRFRKPITRAGWNKCVDEALIKISPTWVDDHTLAPTGFDLPYLIAAQRVMP